MRKYAKVVVILVVVGAIGLVAWPKSPPPIEQPIRFNHKAHVEAAGLECTEFCHSYARVAPVAGIPGKEVCLDCHEDPDEAESPEIKKLAAYEDSPDEIPWVRLTGTRDDVYFSHHRHVALGKLECPVCHPNMPHRESPPTARLPVMRMNTCIDCHKRNAADVDCIACHR